MDEKVYAHFGSAPCFYLYDTENDSLELVMNNNEHLAHGVCKPLASMEGKHVQAVLTVGIGRGALQHLNSEGITVYKLRGESVKEAVATIKEGTFEEITPECSCQGHGCH